MSTQFPGAATRALHSASLSGQPLEPHSILAPIHQTATFVQTRPNDPAVPHTYSRCSNPTVSALEARLESAFEARHALAFKTGLAAISTLFFTALRSGDHVVCGAVVYGGTVRLLRELLGDFGVQVSFVDATDAQAVQAAVRPNSRLLFVETPANPTLAIADLGELERIARTHELLFAVDNTFLTGHLQPVLGTEAGAPYAGERQAEDVQPSGPGTARGASDAVLLRGADVEVLSTTKYVEGHNSTTGGALLTQDSELAERLFRRRATLGNIQAPFDAWLTLRGLGTLPIRLERHSASALFLAEQLTGLPGVRSVHHPFHGARASLATRQQRAGGGVLAFELEPERVATFLGATKLCTLAENLGAAETLLTHPATMTHGQIPEDERAALGIGPGLVRLSVGLEEPSDLLADLRSALEHAEATVRVQREAASGSLESSTPLDRTPSESDLAEAEPRVTRARLESQNKAGGAL